MTHTHRGRVVTLLVCLAAVVLAACGGSDPKGGGPDGKATALTQEQAELFATTRFRNFDAGVRSIAITIPAQTGQSAQSGPAASSGGQIAGWVDFVGHVGYASAQQGGAELGLVLWNGERIAVNESATGPAVLPVPEAGWRSDQLVPNTSLMTQALAIVLNLASDRPENPLLLRQSDAAYLRADEIDGRPVVVLAGPSPASTASASGTPEAPDSNRVRYWIDEDGMLLRVQAKLAGTTGWTVIDLSDGAGVSLDAEQIGRRLGATSQPQ